MVPVCGEAPDFIERLMQHQVTPSVLLIVLLNRPQDHDKSATWQQQNQRLKAHCLAQAKRQHALAAGHHLLLGLAGCDLLLLDFNEHPFDPSKGVGLARKIAADTALRLMLMGRVNSPWIHSTDADVCLPANYFQAAQAQQAAALSLSFEHHSDDPDLQHWQQQYDFKLHYYRQGVQFLGAQYAYIPLGSTLVVHATAYVQVRGFPCRSGGEDFYLLNKLAKVGAVLNVADVVVRIRSRLSDRVPFGTGPAIKRLQQAAARDQSVLYYHPHIFHVLQSWRQELLDYFESQQLPTDDHGLNQYWQLGQLLPKNHSQAKTNQRWQQFVHEWFDAFKILKSVHFLQDQFNSIPQQQLLDMPDYQTIIGAGPD